MHSPEYCHSVSGSSRALCVNEEAEPPSIKEEGISAAELCKGAGRERPGRLGAPDVMFFGQK